MTAIWTGTPGDYPGGSAASMMTTVTDPQAFASRPSRFICLKVTAD